MGGLCSRRSTDESALHGILPHVNGNHGLNSGFVHQSHGLTVQISETDTQSPVIERMDKQLNDPFLFLAMNTTQGTNMDDLSDGIPRLSRALSNKSGSTTSKVAVAKVSELSSLLGKAGTVGLGKAVDVLDTLGSSMTNLNLSSGFASGMATKGNKILILAFEVANTIVKGANLMNSLSEENIRHLKEVVLPSEGVQRLISNDMDELLRIAADDKRGELRVFSKEVVRFGNHCKDPQWHNMERYFEKLELDVTHHNQLKEESDIVLQQLMVMVHYTSELYHELHALDRIEQDCRRKAQEDNCSNAAQRGDGLAILKTELKSQKKHVRGLKKKSLWSKILEEVIEKLVDIVHYLHLEISAAINTAADSKQPIKNADQRLGSAGLALHYANIITQIDTLVTRSSSIPSNTRDTLYQGLPPPMKAALRSRIQSFELKEELNVQQIKAEMEKTLHWLVPMATNTTKAHHGFGWVGEWANTRSENQKVTGQTDLLRIETLHHANKERTEAYILDLIVLLHYLVSISRATNGGFKSPLKSPSLSPNQKTNHLSINRPNPRSPTLSIEDQEMLRDVNKRKLTPGISKSQEFDTAKSRLCKNHRLTKSSSHSPTSETKKDDFLPIRRPSFLPVIDFELDRSKALDVIDRVDSLGTNS